MTRLKAEQLGHTIASLVPEMVNDSRLNNAIMLANMIWEAQVSGETVLKELTPGEKLMREIDAERTFGSRGQ